MVAIEFRPKKKGSFLATGRTICLFLRIIIMFHILITVTLCLPDSWTPDRGRFDSPRPYRFWTCCSKTLPVSAENQMVHLQRFWFILKVNFWWTFWFSSLFKDRSWDDQTGLHWAGSVSPTSREMQNFHGICVKGIFVALHFSIFMATFFTLKVQCTQKCACLPIGVVE